LDSRGAVVEEERVRTAAEALMQRRLHSKAVIDLR